MCEFDGGRADLWMGSKRWVDSGWVCGMWWGLCFLILFLFFCFGGCDLSGCGLIFMGCDGLMLVGGSSCGLIFILFFSWWLWPQPFFW